MCQSKSTDVRSTQHSNESAGGKFPIASMCTPSRRKPQLQPKLCSPADGKQVVEAVDSKLALTAFCTPSRAKSTLNPRRLAHPQATSLALPHSYYLLGELFQSADTIVSWLTNRTEICTFEKLKSAVQDMTKRFETACSLYCMRF